MAKCTDCLKSGLFIKINNDNLCIECELKNLKQTNNRLVDELNKANIAIDELGITDILDKKAKIEKLDNEIKQLEINKKNVIDTLEKITNDANEKASILKNQIIIYEDEVLYQSVGIYKPKYDLTKSEDYKIKLELIRTKQKDLIKSNTATTANSDWTVNNSSSQGQKMIKDLQKLLLRAFNSECDEVIDRVKYNNFDASIKRITTSRDAISKLSAIMKVSITNDYYALKLEELNLSFEYQQKKQEEKEEQKLIRAQMREEAKLQREIEEQRKKIEKEQSHYQNALEKINAQIARASDIEVNELYEKKKEIELKLADTNKVIQDIDYRQANQRAGYVYIISNLGAFGENIYKIGMTRRLDPLERIDELGDASVPFNFDVHAMIFCDDAPALETALHKAFENKKLNWVNTRREFFNVSLDEIKKVVKENYDKTIEFIDFPDAEQYRISQKMQEKIIA